MSTLWENGDRGLKSTSGLKAAHSTLQPRIKSLRSPSILFKKKIVESAFFHDFASFQVNKYPLYGQMEKGA